MLGLLAATLLLGGCTGQHTTRTAASTTYTPHIKASSQDVLDGAINADEPGCSAAVGVEGKVIWSGVRGIADLASGAKITTDTVFDIASVSKQFTATAILLLVEAGKLTLDDPISQYVPELPDWAQTVTVEQLMHQTSGIPDYVALLAARGYQVSDRTIEAEARQALAAAPELQFKPGTRFDYSNSNYLLLGEIVHRASGQPLPEFLSAEIFQPLGLAMVVDPVGKVPNKAVSYEKGTGGNRSEYRVGNPAWEQIGDGGIQTTPSQLARWADNYRTGSVGGLKLLEAQLAGAVETEPGGGDRYGAGIVSRADGTLDHAGAWAGFVTAFHISSDRRTSVAISCNTDKPDPVAMADALGAPLDVAGLPRLAAGTQAAIIHGMAQPPSLLTTDNGLPFGVQGACDSRFTGVIRAFAGLYPGRKFGGGALSVYIDGRQVVDVWTGWSDRQGKVPWTADTGAMVFSATKGLAATVIHRLVDRGLLSYDAPVAEYWPEFGANGKSEVTVSDVLRHRSGLAHLKGVDKDEVMDHLLMEQKLAAAPLDRQHGKLAYHAVTYGWLLSGLARAVTGKGMRELFREELARPLNTDGIHLGRPPADSPTKAAQTLLPQAKVPTPLLDFIAPKVAGLSFSGLLGAVYFPGILSLLQDDMPFLDGEVPAVNGVVTARALAKTYGALANDGVIDGTRLLSSQAVRGLTGKSELWPDLNLGLPFTYHQGYQSSPVPGLLEGYGHIGLGGTIGWADPETGSAFGYVHNRLLTLLLFDIGSFAGLAALLNSAVVAARRDDPLEVPHFGAPYSEPRHEQAASGA